MKCKICGAKLRKEGDICKSCYDEYCKEEELEKDVQEIYKLHSKYLPKYQLTQYGDGYIMALIILIVCISYNQYLYFFLALLLSIIVLVLALALAKRKAVQTTCTFYNKKIVWRYKDRHKTIAYSNLKNIGYYQNFFQKIFKLADIHFYPKEGTFLIDGFSIKNVHNFDEKWKKINELINSKREN